MNKMLVSTQNLSNYDFVVENITAINLNILKRTKGIKITSQEFDELFVLQKFMGISTTEANPCGERYVF